MAVASVAVASTKTATAVVDKPGKSPSIPAENWIAQARCTASTSVLVMWLSVQSEPKEVLMNVDVHVPLSRGYILVCTGARSTCTAVHI